MIKYYDEFGEVKNAEIISFKEFFNQYHGEPLRILEEYIQYGGLQCVHDICPFNDIPEGTKIAEYVASEKKKMIKRICKGMIDFFCKYNNLHDKKNVERFFKQIAKDNGVVVTPYKIETELAEENHGNSTRIRDITIKKYLELLCMNDIAKQVKVYDPLKKKYMVNGANYYFTDIGMAKSLSGKKYDLKCLYSTLIVNAPKLSEAEITTAKFSKIVRNGDLVSRVPYAVDLLIPADEYGGFAFQVLPQFGINQVREAVKALNVLGEKYNKFIITSDDRETKAKIQDICAEGVSHIEVMSITEFLLEY